jgi:hypothetical protein
MYDSNLALIITIATKFLSKHCMKRLLDTEINGYHCFNFLTSRSVDPKQPSHFHFVPSLKLIPKGRCMTFQERCKTISGEVHTSPHLASKSGLDANKSPQLERAY